MEAWPFSSWRKEDDGDRRLRSLQTALADYDDQWARDKAAVARLTKLVDTQDALITQLVDYINQSGGALVRKPPAATASSDATAPTRARPQTGWASAAPAAAPPKVTVAVSLVLGDGVSDLLAGEVLSRVKPALPAHLLLSASPRPATTAGGSGPVVPILLFWRLDGRYKDLVNQIVLRLSELAPPGPSRGRVAVVMMVPATSQGLNDEHRQSILAGGAAAVVEAIIQDDWNPNINKLEPHLTALPQAALGELVRFLCAGIVYS